MALTVDLPIYLSEKYPSDWAKSGIYKIKSPSGSVYIGQSVDLKRRFQRYKSLDCKTQIALFRSFSKYGVKNHMFVVLKSVDEDRFNTLTLLEQHYIDLYRNKGVNILNIKEAGSTGRLSEETKRKIGDAVRGEKNGNFGRKFTKEHLRNISESHKGNPGYWKGKKLPEHVVDKFRDRLRGKPGLRLGLSHTEESKQLMSMVKLGKKLTGNALTVARATLAVQAEKRKRPVKVIDLINNIEYVFEYAKPASLFVGMSSYNGISGVITSKEQVYKNRYKITWP